MKLKVFYFLLAIAFVTIIVTGLPGTCYACKCTEPDSVDVEFERSEAVFTGKVKKIIQKKDFRGSTYQVLFEVKETWKGVSKSQVIIEPDITDCGVHFVKGVEYLVYAESTKPFNGREGLTTICGRTGVLELAIEDLEQLGEGEKPSKEVNLLTKSTPIVTFIWIFGLVLIGICILWVRNMTKKRSG